MLKTRDQIADNLKWDLTSLVADENQLQDILKSVKEKMPEMSKFDGKLTKDNTYLCLNLQSEISREIERLYVYANLKSDENSADTKYQALSESFSMLSVDFNNITSFINPQLSRLQLQELEEMLQNPAYIRHTTYLKAIIRYKEHLLSDAEEKIMSEISGFSKDFKTIFGMFDNADVKFDSILDQNGNKVDISHGIYSVMLQNPDQRVRRDAFLSNYKSYKAMINTITATYLGNVKKNAILSKLRKYNSAMDNALFSESIDPIVYDNLIDVVHQFMPTMHDYVATRKRVLGLEVLNMYDMYLPLTADYQLVLDYPSAYNLIEEALLPLGQNYINILKTARIGGWIDVEETPNKRSGAYSWGAYDSHPYVLLNHQATTHDIFTIAHEMGHAIHSYLSNSNQCYEKAGYEIFVAEVASTVNEVLLLKHLLKTAKGQERIFLLAYYLDMFRTTLFRQTMFSEFEKFAHNSIEKGESLTHEDLNGFYLNLNKQYYGSSVEHNPDIAYEWCRIPHFYNAFYVYKYATGLTSAVAIAKAIIEDNKNSVPKYIEFLSSGGSMEPLDLLKIVDVDLTSTKPFLDAMQEFCDTLAELKRMI